MWMTPDRQLRAARKRSLVLAPPRPFRYEGGGDISETPMPPVRAAFDRATLAFLGVLVVVTWLRIEALRLSPLGLYFDEAQ